MSDIRLSLNQGGDKTIPTPRPSFFISGDKPGTDVAAGSAAAFAASAIFYWSTIGDQQYAKTLLQHALSLYYFAESAPKTLYQKSVPAVKEWYASSDYSVSLVRNSQGREERRLSAATWRNRMSWFLAL